MIFKKESLNFIPIGLLLLLVFILPIPHTIGLRNGIFYFLLMFSFISIYKLRENIKFSIFNNKILKISLILFIIVFSSSLFSHDIKLSLDEFRGQWLTSSLYIILGLFLAQIYIVKKTITLEGLITLMFYGFFIHILYIDCMSLYEYISSGVLLKRYGGLMQHPTIANYTTNICIAFIFSEIIYRIRTSEKVLQIKTVYLVIFFFISILSSVIEAMRNGSVAIVFMITMAIFFLFYKNKRIKIKYRLILSMVLIVVLSIPITYNVKNDYRWNTLIDTIPVALNTTKNFAWLDDSISYPKLKNGQTVNGSNYLRLSFMFEGLKQIYEKPLGIGYSRNAFGHAMQNKYGKGKGYHSHSSIIDFTIGVGIQGLLLWIFFIFLILMYAIRVYKKEVNYYSILLFFLTSGFFVRSLVDGNMRDHIMIQYFLILGVLLAILFNLENKHEKTKVY